MKLLVKPRLYQEKIFASAVKSNTLIVLPTGLGKTIIALMIALHKLKDGPVLFLAPTKPLVDQHFKSFISDSDLTVSDCSVVNGSVKPSDRDYNARVVFATPQTVRNDIIRGALDVNHFSLIIFDESHRAVGGYAYTFIASVFNNLIIGLTASPGTSPEQVKLICDNLKISRVESRFESDLDVKPYLKPKKVFSVFVDLPDGFKQVIKLLNKVLSRNLLILKDAGLVKSASVKSVSKRDLLRLQRELVSKSDFSGVSMIARTIKVLHALELIQSQGAGPLKAYFDGLKRQSSRAASSLLLDDDFVKAMSLTYELTVSHPKLESLVKLLRPGEFNLVFTQFRSTAKLITDFINERVGGAKLFVGQRGMSQREQLSVLESFRRGEFSTLVSTSVSEEGLDIPSIDNAIFYEPVPSALRTVQRLGRVGRAKAGRVFVLIARGTIDEGYYWTAHHKSKRIRQAVNSLNLSQSNLNFFIS